MRRAVVLLGIALSGCGGLAGEECQSGEASNIRIVGADGAQIPVDHRVCAFGSRDGAGKLSSIEVDLDVGTLSTLMISGPRLEELGAEARCDKQVSVTVYDDPPNATEYYTDDWFARASAGDSSCELVATRQGDAIEGTFQGRMMRVKIRGEEAEFLEVSFRYSVRSPLE